jgi:Lysozyme like domain
MPKRRQNPIPRRRVPLKQALRHYAVSTLRGSAQALRGLTGPGSGSAILTPAQIRWYAQNAGFSGADLDTAVAVALAESSGNARIYSPEPQAGTPQGKGSYGLWQIYLQAHPEFAGQDLYDPQTNAAAAFSVYSSAGGFSPWSAYKSGRYQAYLRSGSPPPVITIDPATGAVVPDDTAIAAAAKPSAGTILLLTGSAIAAYLAADLFFD